MKFTSVFLSMLSIVLSLPAKALATDSFVDPYIRFISTSSFIKEPMGDFYRVTVYNTEKNPCLTLETINVRNLEGRQPRVKRSTLCAFVDEQSQYSLKNSQNVEFNHFNWVDSRLDFTLTYLAAIPHAEMMDYKCQVDAAVPHPLISCS